MSQVSDSPVDDQVLLRTLLKHPWAEGPPFIVLPTSSPSVTTGGPLETSCGLVLCLDFCSGEGTSSPVCESQVSHSGWEGSW